MSEITIRRRLGRSTSVKGVVTPDATIEVTGATEAYFWKLHDEFMEQVNKRYPPVQEQTEKGKKE